MNKKTLFPILLGMLVLPISVLAQVVNPGQANDIAITDLAFNVGNVIWIVATIIILVFWVITGILFLTATGDPTKLGTAKKALWASIAGTVIVVLAWSAINIISNAIFFGR